MDTEKKHTLKAIAITACCLLLAGACENNDRIEIETPAKDVVLTFNASITNTVVTETRGIIPIEGFTGDSYNFGISITKSNNEVFEGSGDMTATMSNPPSTPDGEWSWMLKRNSDNTLITDPKVPTGRELKVIAYYSADKVTDAFTTGVPFDFTNISDSKKQTEILYNINTAYTASPSTEKATIPLRFQHAYSRIVINVTKYINKGDFTLSSVSIDNLAGEWIKNSGNIDPETGLVMTGATAGAISETRNPQVLTVDKPITYEFLVPSFMDSGVNDANLTILMMINGIKEVFTLNREHLNKDGNLYGFRQGYKNTYNLVFNNSCLNLSLLNWTSVPIDGNFGNPPSSSGNLVKINLTTKYWSSLYIPNVVNGPFPPKPQFLTANNHIFQSYLTTVDYGSNGDYIEAKPVTTDPPKDAYIIEDDENVYTLEKAYPILQVTQDNISTESVSWEDANGQLTAKEICKKYNGGNFHDWRLPRAGELRAIMILSAMNGDLITSLQFGNDSNIEKPYWTATEVNENEAWSMRFYREDSRRTGPKLSPLNKKEKAYVRCVRETN